MIKASTNSAMDLSGVADRVNSAAEARRRAIINDPDAVVDIVERGLNRRNHPEIYKLDTMAIVSEQATRGRKDAHTAKNEPEDEFPLLRAFGYGFSFAMTIMLVAALIANLAGW